MSALRCEKLCDEICSILEPIFRIDDKTFNPVPWDTSYSSIERAIEMLQEIDAKIERHEQYYYQ